MTDSTPTVAGAYGGQLTGAWIGLFVLVMSLVMLFSIIQPLGRTPDEIAHMQYVSFLTENHRLPTFAPIGGGEGGYEAQHPPLYYAVMAVAYGATEVLEERWRWHVLRWLTALLVGGGGLLVVRALFRRLCGDTPRLALAGASAVMLMPLTVLYACHINPDGPAFLLVTVALYLALLTAHEPPSLTRALLLGITIGAASLVKISALIALVPPVVAWAYLARGKKPKGWHRDMAVTMGFAFAIGAWWYVRNAVYYGSPFIHTSAPYGSALENAFASGRFGFFAWLAIRETFLSTWIQRGWLPSGPLEWGFYGLIGVLLAVAITGWITRTSEDGEGATSYRTTGAVISLVLLISVLIGQQSAFWLSDVEFNAGGRYVLMAMPGIVHLILSGWSRLLNRRVSLIVFGSLSAALVVVNVLSAWHIVTVLNSRYAPGWKIFHFPPG